MDVILEDDAACQEEILHGPSNSVNMDDTPANHRDRVNGFGGRDSPTFPANCANGSDSRNNPVYPCDVGESVEYRHLHQKAAQILRVPDGEVGVDIQKLAAYTELVLAHLKTRTHKGFNNRLVDMIEALCGFLEGLDHVSGGRQPQQHRSSQGSDPIKLVDQHPSSQGVHIGGSDLNPHPQQLASGYEQPSPLGNGSGRGLPHNPGELYQDAPHEAPRGLQQNPLRLAQTNDAGTVNPLRPENRSNTLYYVTADVYSRYSKCQACSWQTPKDDAPTPIRVWTYRLEAPRLTRNGRGSTICTECSESGFGGTLNLHRVDGPTWEVVRDDGRIILLKILPEADRDFDDPRTWYVGDPTDIIPRPLVYDDNREIEVSVIGRQSPNETNHPNVPIDTRQMPLSSPEQAERRLQFL